MPSSAPSVIDLEPSSGFGRQVLKWGAGFGMSLAILVILAHVQRTEVELPPAPIADLQTIVLEDPPPPPPEIATREPPPPTVLDLDPVPSDNVVKIQVAALTYEVPLPEATPILEFNLADFKPDLKSGENDPNHIFQFRDVDQRPVVIHRKKPDVSNELLRTVKDPRVVVSMVVTRAGSVRNISPVQSSNNRELDKLVMEALSEWRFRPAIKNGNAVNCMVIQSIVIKPSRGGSPFSL